MVIVSQLQKALLHALQWLHRSVAEYGRIACRHSRIIAVTPAEALRPGINGANGRQ